ncbi:MAG: SRPBCC family protein [Fimbriimonadaceae bacterium]|nr:SRPBCC family protein [Fimbriimonadaceae bacterium]
MKEHTAHEPNPKLDLVLERKIDVPASLVWRAWTEPELLMQWFCPLPWRTTACEIDLRPGGVFSSVMEGPEGERHDSEGCFLDVIPNEKLVWTSCMLRGYRPNLAPSGAECNEIHFTAIVTMEQVEDETRYRVIAVHGDESSKNRHAEMGFDQGWGAAYDQMASMLRDMKS